MNWLEFLSSLAWPAVVLIAILKLQNPLSNLISTVAKIKYKDWEFEFLLDAKIEEIKRVVDSNIALTEKKGSIPVDTNKIKKREKKGTPLSGFKYMNRKNRYTSLLKCREELFFTVRQLFKMANIDEPNDNLNEDHYISYMINNLISKEFISKDLGEATLEAWKVVSSFTIADAVSGFLMNKYLEAVEGIISILENKITELEEKESS
ncbi:hypothetical protein MOE82_03720 [Bacillus licheniformis]|uniref:hypothetical protein n=1 Tax=Bacillus TaxID=1386 RepID=UPI0022801477|nr:MULTISPECIES: hypothetical protein [Bacillus]MCY8341145.1 hypothetical protein [Bacillus haynesii]MCY9349877.1 hypothetical protein [Bacillus licheniformis]